LTPGLSTLAPITWMSSAANASSRPLNSTASVVQPPVLALG
jgi:hypothetical protein